MDQPTYFLDQEKGASSDFYSSESYLFDVFNVQEM